MSELEEKLRTALVEKKIKEFHDVTLSDNRYRTLMNDFLDEWVGSMTDSLSRRDDLTQGEKERRKTYYHVVFLPQMKEQLLEPESLRQTAINAAEFCYITPDRLMMKLKPIIEDMKSYKIDEGVSSLEETFAMSAECFIPNQLILNRLVEIARKDGLNKALKVETEYEVVRELFPTPEDYIIHEQKVQRIARDIFIKNLEFAKGKVSEENFPTEFVESLKEVFGDVGEKLHTYLASKTVQAIYGIEYD